MKEKTLGTIRSVFLGLVPSGLVVMFSSFALFPKENFWGGIMAFGGVFLGLGSLVAFIYFNEKRGVDYYETLEPYEGF